jgi:hypothetical protein
MFNFFQLLLDNLSFSHLWIKSLLSYENKMIKYKIKLEIKEKNLDEIVTIINYSKI